MSPIFWIYDFNLGLRHKTALAYIKSSSSLSFSLCQVWWLAYGRCLMQIWWLIVYVCWEGDKVEACTLQKSRSYRRQPAWVELGPALSREKWFNKCVGMLLPFCMIISRSQGSGHCYDTKTTVAKEPWMCKVRLGSRRGHFFHKRKCCLFPACTQWPFWPRVKGWQIVRGR